MPRACTPSRPSSTPTSTCARPARSTRRTSRPAPAPLPRAATAGSSRWRTPSRRSSPPPTSAPCASGADAEASVPVGFLATVTRGMKGEELTEMAELRDAGAVGFTDDGLPIRNARVMRRALQYQRLCGGQIALHEEDPELSGGGVMHEGAVSAALGMAGVPSVSESTMIARDCALAAYEDARIHVQHLSAVESVEAVARRQGGRGARSPARRPRTTSASPTRRSAASTARFKMNPPLRSEDDRQALIEGCATAPIDCIATDHAPHSRRREGGALRAGGDGRDRARDRLRRAPHRAGPARVVDLGLLVERLAAGAAPFGIERPTLALGSRPTSPSVDLEAEWKVGEDGYESRSLELLVRGPHADRPRPDDDRRRPASPTACAASRLGVGRMSASAPATCCSRTAPASTASCAAPTATGRRRGRVQHLDDRLPGGGHRSLLRGPDHHLHLPADRQLRRRGEAMESDRIHARARDHARRQELRGCRQRRGRLARLAARLRRARDHRRRHPGAGPPHPRPRARCAAASSRPRRSRGRGARADRRRAVDGGRRLRQHRHPGEPIELRRRRPARRRDRHRDQALDRPPAPRARLPARRCCPAPAAPRTVLARGSRPRLPRQRPGRPGRARLRRREGPRARRQEAGRRHLPRPPAALPRGRARHLQAARSATAAPTIRSRTWRRAGSTSPRRTTASRSPGPAAARRSRATSRCAGTPTSAPPSSPT